jgi:hypothetical protein
MASSLVMTFFIIVANGLAKARLQLALGFVVVRF